MNHAFLLAPDNEPYFHHKIVWGKNGIDTKMSGIIEYIGIDEDLILYFMDFLKWMPTYNPETKVEDHGLNYFGITLIRKKEAMFARELFKTISKILSFGPDNYYLMRKFFHFEDKPYIGIYEKIRIEKEKVVEQFSSLSAYANKVLESNYNILHIGI